jgi:hypothetical protein
MSATGNPGACLNSLVLANHPDLRSKSTPTLNPQPTPSQQRYVEEPEGTPASDEVARAAIAEIMAKLNRKAGWLWKRLFPLSS